MPILVKCNCPRIITVASNSVCSFFVPLGLRILLIP